MNSSFTKQPNAPNLTPAPGFTLMKTAQGARHWYALLYGVSDGKQGRALVSRYAEGEWEHFEAGTVEDMNRVFDVLSSTAKKKPSTVEPIVVPDEPPRVSQNTHLANYGRF